MAKKLPSADQMRADLFAQLPPSTGDLVQAIVTAGAGRGSVFAVGGVVRDLILGRPIVDVDLVTEGDAIVAVAEAAPGMQETTHERFRTASISAGDVWIDVATARRETYAHPGALPDIEPAGIAADLARRDFSINAVALRLDGDAMLLDPCGGIADVEARLVRILHDASFRDDATRIFRAIRYATRLGFEIESHTLSTLRHSLPLIATIGGERLRRELELMIEEPRAGAALEISAREGVLAATHTALSWDAKRSAALAAPIARPPSGATLGFALLAAEAPPEQAAAIIERLKLTRLEAAAVRGLASMGEVAPMLRRPDAKPSGVVVLLDRFPAVAIAAFAATTADEIAGRLALRYLEEWRYVKPLLDGDDIIGLGVPAGPQVRRGLQLVRAARLDGWAVDRDDERALGLRFAKSIRDSDAAGDVSFHDN